MEMPCMWQGTCKFIRIQMVHAESPRFNPQCVHRYMLNFARFSCEAVHIHARKFKFIRIQISGLPPMGNAIRFRKGNQRNQIH